HQSFRVHWIRVHRAVEVPAKISVVIEAHNEVVSHVVLKAKADLVGVGILKIFRNRESEGLNRDGNAIGQVVLIDENRVRQACIEALLIRQVPKLSGGTGIAASVEDSLEKIRSIQVRSRRR